MKNAPLSGAQRGASGSRCRQAAVNHIAVSKALLIKGMFMPKLLFAALFAAGLTGFSAGRLWPSFARQAEKWPGNLVPLAFAATFAVLSRPGRVVQRIV